MLEWGTSHSPAQNRHALTTALTRSKGRSNRYRLSPDAFMAVSSPSLVSCPKVYRLASNRLTGMVSTKI